MAARRNSYETASRTARRRRPRSKSKKTGGSSDGGATPNARQQRAVLATGELDAAATAAKHLTPADPLIADLRSLITESQIGDTVARYSGAANLNGSSSVRVISRNAHHKRDNERAVAQLVVDFSFRDTIKARPLQFPFLGSAYRDNVEARFVTTTAKAVVIVAAHLDSTAKGDGNGYDPSTGRAPGADDDATGIAAVLAIARAVDRLHAATTSKCEIRFVLFNAEEENFLGSADYVSQWPSSGPPLLAVVQLDMLGRRPKPRAGGKLPFEIHTGADDDYVEAWSRSLAGVLDAVVPKVAPELVPLVYPGASNLDPAQGRSDHKSFHSAGWGAVVVSEEFYTGPDATPPVPLPNETYHRSSDVIDQVDSGYAASIARVTAAAAIVIARSYDVRHP